MDGIIYNTEKCGLVIRIVFQYSILLFNNGVVHIAAQQVLFNGNWNDDKFWS